MCVCVLNKWIKLEFESAAYWNGNIMPEPLWRVIPHCLLHLQLWVCAPGFYKFRTWNMITRASAGIQINSPCCMSKLLYRVILSSHFYSTAVCARAGVKLKEKPSDSISKYNTSVSVRFSGSTLNSAPEHAAELFQRPELVFPCRPTVHLDWPYFCQGNCILISLS